MKLLYFLVSIAVYVALCYSPIAYLTIPIGLLCTFLHEFGHAFFALISGGDVHSLCVNTDCSGVTMTSGGSRGLILIGGYVGSAIFGNLMLIMSTNKLSGITLKVISIIMLFSSLLWFDNFITSLILIAFSISLFLLSKTEMKTFTLSFLGATSIFYIIQDFNVGPSSDIKAYEKEIGFFSEGIWMYIWLVIVVVLTLINLFNLFKNIKTKTF